MNNLYSVVITTCENSDDAKIIIDSLLDKNLVACAQMFSISSCYSWKGAIATDPEVIILLKCKTSLYSEIENDIISNHKYETPEIISLPIINGSENYLKWIDDVSK